MPGTGTRKTLLLGLWFSLCAAITGCAGLPGATETPPPTTAMTQQASATSWWNVRFQMAWPEKEEPAWHLDLLVADRIIAPVLKDNAATLPLWRFHRRALRDDKGHQFSFVFFASPDDGRKIAQEIAANADLRELMDEGIIRHVRYEEPLDTALPRIEDGSDRRWSLAMQKSWPYFIMGVSRTWLSLVSEQVEQAGGTATVRTGEDLVAFYRSVSDAVNALWREEGGHAFFHHLNALFGYEDVFVHERRLMTF